MSLYNTVSMNDGLLMGGFGSMAELSTNGLSGNALNGYYQEDGHVVYGATADGTRKFLSGSTCSMKRGSSTLRTCRTA